MPAGCRGPLHADSERCRPPALPHSILAGYAAGPRAPQPDANRDEIHTATARCPAPAGTARNIAGTAIDLPVSSSPKWWHRTHPDRSQAWSTANHEPVERERAARRAAAL
ncbi:hypothetical protein ABZ599_36665 [Streptomyces misionensis]|uniref:hypothetical protein n=1 Tax=Streptomyces misionensis TaxID=67331 RepID=UPI00340254A5